MSNKQPGHAWGQRKKGAGSDLFIPLWSVTDMLQQQQHDAVQGLDLPLLSLGGVDLVCVGEPM